MEGAAVLKALNRDTPENSVLITRGRLAMVRKMKQREEEEWQQRGDRCMRAWDTSCSRPWDGCGKTAECSESIFFFYDRAMILLQRIRSTMKKQRLKLFPRDKLRRKSSILFGYNHFQKVCLVCVCVCVFPFLNQPTTQTNPWRPDVTVCLHFQVPREMEY